VRVGAGAAHNALPSTNFLCFAHQLSAQHLRPRAPGSSQILATTLSLMCLHSTPSRTNLHTCAVVMAMFRFSGFCGFRVCEVYGLRAGKDMCSASARE
jgi:hypothetical protein